MPSPCKFEKIDLFDRPNEATTEQELIRPVLETLGWRDLLATAISSWRRGCPRPSAV